MGESRETTIILVIIFLVLVGSLIGISITVYSIAQNTGDFVSTQRRSKIPTVFRNPENIDTTPAPTKEYKFPDTYQFEVGQEGAYKLFTGILSYDFAVFEEADLDRSVNVDLDDNDDGLYSDLIKKHIDDSEEINQDFFSLEIPRLQIRTQIYQDVDRNEALYRGWWMLPSIYNTTEGEKIIFCERNAFEVTDVRSCYYIDEVVEGDYILVYSLDGELLKYKVLSTSIVPERTDTILKPSENEYLRIITYSDENGDLPGNDYRIVILAELITDDEQ